MVKNELYNRLILFCLENSLENKPDDIQERSFYLTFNSLSLDEKRDFYDYLGQMCKLEKPETQILAFSKVYHKTKDAECLNKLDELVYNVDIDFNKLAGMSINIDIERFCRVFPQPEYLRQKEKLRYLTKSLLDVLNIEKNWIVPSERNQENIVVTLDPLLDRSHAPTCMAIDLCKILKRQGYRIVIIVCAAHDKIITRSCQNIWFEEKVTHYEKNGIYTVEDGEDRFPVIQMPVSVENAENLRWLVQQIHEWKPLYIWNLGGNSSMNEIFGRDTTLVSMPCSVGISVSDAPILIRYLKNDEEVEIEKNQHIIDMTWDNLSVSDVENKSREELGLPEDTFLIAIMGNRLDTEITEEFLNIMQKIIENNEKILFVIIGNCTKQFGKIRKYIHYLGFRTDYKEILQVCDLFINPKRDGGGGGGRAAVLLRTPVVTLPNCDVAGSVGEAFLVDNYEEYISIVNRYVNDPEFRDKQIGECEKIIKANEKFDLEKEVKRVDKVIRELIFNN